MSARSRRRRARAEGLPEISPRERAPRRGLPALPVIAGVAGLVLIGSAWSTRWAPGAARASGDTAARFTVEIPADQQRVINSWQRFFICYDLAYENVIDPTLRANLRATGSLQFPGDKVEVELPAAGSRATAAEGGAEDELIQVRQSVLDALSRDATGARQQCAGGVPVPTAPAAVPAQPARPAANSARPAPAEATPNRSAPAAQPRPAPARTPPAARER